MLVRCRTVRNAIYMEIGQFRCNFGELYEALSPVMVWVSVTEAVTLMMAKASRKHHRKDTITFLLKGAAAPMMIAKAGRITISSLQFTLSSKQFILSSLQQ